MIKTNEAPKHYDYYVVICRITILWSWEIPNIIFFLRNTEVNYLENMYLKYLLEVSVVNIYSKLCGKKFRKGAKLHYSGLSKMYLSNLAIFMSRPSCNYFVIHQGQQFKLWITTNPKNYCLFLRHFLLCWNFGIGVSWSKKLQPNFLNWPIIM